MRRQIKNCISDAAIIAFSSKLIEPVRVIDKCRVKRKLGYSFFSKNNINLSLFLIKNIR